MLRFATQISTVVTREVLTQTGTTLTRENLASAFGIHNQHKKSLSPLRGFSSVLHSHWSRIVNRNEGL